MALPANMTRMTNRLQPVLFRHFCSNPSTTSSPSDRHAAPPPPLLRNQPAWNQSNSADREKRYVRIAGPSSYASKEDIAYFLGQHDIPIPDGRKSIVQGQSDIFQNHSVWVMETQSQREASDIASKISGRVLGLKLIRAAAVDQKLYDGLVAPAESQGSDKTKHTSLRKRMAVIAPHKNERGRALLAKNLAHGLYPRALWSFFSAYDVVDVRHLRRSGVACIIFETEQEACRALRERKNVPLQRQYPLALKMHE